MPFATQFRTRLRFDMTEPEMIALAREIDPASGVGFPDGTEAPSIEFVFSDTWENVTIRYGRA